MSLAEERPVKLAPEILQSMVRVDTKKHDELDKQMKEWESKKGNKVYYAKHGESAEYNPLRMDSIARGAKMGGSANKTKALPDRPIVMFPDNSKRRNRTIRSSNHQNLSLRPNGKIEVKVGSFYLGLFTDEAKALKSRDEFREKTGLPKAEY
jgi:hypothetical protein